MDGSIENVANLPFVVGNVQRKALFYNTTQSEYRSGDARMDITNYYPAQKGMKLWNRIPTRSIDNTIHISPVIDKEIFISTPPSERNISEHGEPIIIKEFISKTTSQESLCEPDKTPELPQSPSTIRMSVSPNFKERDNGNPFAIFNAKGSLKDSDVAYIRGVLNSGVFSDDTLLGYFKQVISPASKQMLSNIVLVFSDLMKANPQVRPLGVRLLSCALAFYPDDFVQIYYPNFLIALFIPELDDDVGGRFIRILLNYKSLFNSPGTVHPNVPVCVNSDGTLAYGDLKYKPSACTRGKIETLVILMICLQRAQVDTVFDLPASRLRDWLCTIWYELPDTRPRMPLVRMCLHWIDSRVDHMLLKDGAFALLTDHIKRLNTKNGIHDSIIGTKVLLMHFFHFCLLKQANVHPQIEHVLELVCDNEDDLYIALDAIVSGWKEADMLDLWCCLCMLPWTPKDMSSSPIIMIMSILLKTYYNIAIQDTSDTLDEKDGTLVGMGLVEGCIRISISRCCSPLIAYTALLQTTVFVGLGKFAVLNSDNASMLLTSVPQLMFKYYFLWLCVNDSVDTKTLQLMEQLYTLISRAVKCRDLREAKTIVPDWSACQQPLFPRIPKVDKNEQLELVPDQLENHSPPQKPIPGPRFIDTPSNRNISGLRNLGNTCYFNSLMQALYHTRYFVYCLNTLEIYTPLAHSMRKLFTKMATKGGTVSPSSTLSLLPKHLSNGEQQDVTEFYRFLLDSLDPKNTSDIWNKVFAGLIVQNIKCMRCRRVSSVESTIYDFNLCSINSSLKGLFEGFCSREHLKGDNKYFCENCKSKQNAEMWNEITSPPAHLFIILGRNMGIDGQKDKSQVSLEPELEIGSFIYRIYGAIFHSGETSDSGHYYFIGCDSELLTEWHKFDDSFVYEIDPNVLADGNYSPSHVPYVVFYRCLEAPQTPRIH
ncbi:bifunctional Ubiquitin specific protease domain/Peptidase C19 [Babesia duncani]|uniref:Bifunctional Ubiquitin specific protease domain/Peptidase C19 n=1 Tax=Babesia duncani TaxID=323732 RepID=A0AAD9UNS6_9APIC|nr:bifunctional Ubiquitin specific protease domain/Peptidase C19 [Babesia duncani]